VKKCFKKRRVQGSQVGHTSGSSGWMLERLSIKGGGGHLVGGGEEGVLGLQVRRGRGNRASKPVSKNTAQGRVSCKLYLKGKWGNRASGRG